MGGTNTNAMRSAGHDNNMKHDMKHDSSNLHGSMNHLGGLVGGRKRSKKSRKSRSKRSKSHHYKRVKRGGMGAGFGFGAALKEAIVPFGIFAMQKKSQRRHSNKKSFRRNRTNKRRRR